MNCRILGFTVPGAFNDGVNLVFFFPSLCSVYLESAGKMRGKLVP